MLGREIISAQLAQLTTGAKILNVTRLPFMKTEWLAVKKWTKSCSQMKIIS